MCVDLYEINHLSFGFSAKDSRGPGVDTVGSYSPGRGAGPGGEGLLSAESRALEQPFNFISI